MIEKNIKKDFFSIDHKKITVYPSETADRPVLYLNTVAEEGDLLYESLRNANCPDFTLVTISGLNWNQEMTPWEIPPLFRDDSPYSGGADEYLEFFTKDILPRAERIAPGHVTARGLAGYSLAGLFALYAAYRTDHFSMIASISGSLWFPDFKEYAFSHEMQRRPDHLYLSLGDKERQSRNPYLKKVQEHTEELCRFYTEKGIHTHYQLNPGNHFRDPVPRTAAGISWLIGQASPHPRQS